MGEWGKMPNSERNSLGADGSISVSAVMLMTETQLSMWGPANRTE